MKYTLVRMGLVLLGSLVTFNGPANAGWGLLGGSGGGSSGGSSGYVAASNGGSSGGAVTAAYASYGSSGGGASSGGASSGGAASSGGSSGAPGLLQRVSSRIHEHLAQKRANHAARRAAYGSSGGGSSGGASSGGYTASYASSGGGSSGGSSGSYRGGSSGGSVSYGSTGYGSVGSSFGSAGSGYYGASTRSNFSAAALVSNVATKQDAVYMTVAVPSNAIVFVNGNPTTSTGSVRQFVSRGLEPGKNYNFDIRAEITGVDGQVIHEEKSISVAAGQREQVQFAFAESKAAIETAVTLNLPEGAHVTLAGNPTKATGTQRTFRTSNLKPGQAWDDYEIEVKLGEQVKRQTVRLIAGDNLELSFNFDDSTLVAAR
jgi:uncharacterized protein (TIGR03000 family)